MSDAGRIATRRPAGTDAPTALGVPAATSTAPVIPTAPDVLSDTPATAVPSAVLVGSSGAPSVPITTVATSTAPDTPAATAAPSINPSVPSGASAAPAASSTPTSFNVEGISIESDGNPRSESVDVESVGLVPRKKTPATQPSAEMDTLSEGNSGHYENQTKGILLIGPALCLLILLGPLGGGFAFLLTPAQFASFGLLPFFKKDEEQVWVADLSNTPLDSVVRAAERDSLVTAPIAARDGIIVPKANANEISRIVDLMRPIIGEAHAKELRQGLSTGTVNLAEFSPDSDLSAKLRSFIENTSDADLKQQVVGKFADIFSLSQTERENFGAREASEASLKTLKELSSAMESIGSRPASRVAPSRVPSPVAAR